MNSINLSVALVTRNRPESLERCLKSWRSQTIAPFEIVVSDDSDQSYILEIQKLADIYGCIYTEGSKRGLYANRNHASLTCKGTHILSADDDHTHPIDYVEKILMLIKTNVQTVWIFSERHPSNPDAPLVCPSQYIKGGKIGISKNVNDCASIADGSSVYPRQIFDQGLRYDETYRFGSMWYLWGHTLKNKGWMICFSDQTFVWHHCESDGREFDPSWLKNQIEANLYCLLVFTFFLKPSIEGATRSFYNLFKSLAFSQSIQGYKVKTRLSLQNTQRLVVNFFEARKFY